MAEFNADNPSIAPEPTPDPDIQLAPPADAETGDEPTAAERMAASTPQGVDAAIADLAQDYADDPRVVDPDPEPSSTAVALADKFDVATAGENWKHDFLTFKGDRLGIRVPTRQALAAFSLATGKYVDMGVKNDITGMFIARHLSPESYGRVFSRLMDPDEQDYTVDTVGELFNAIVTASLDDDDTQQ